MVSLNDAWQICDNFWLHFNTTREFKSLSFFLNLTIDFCRAIPNGFNFTGTTAFFCDFANVFVGRFPGDFAFAGLFQTNGGGLITNQS